MKKLLSLVMVLGLVTSAFIAPASAAKKKKKKKTKPVATTLFFHGNAPVGEPDGVDGAVNGSGYGTMDKEEPSGGAPKSMSLVSYVAGPNTTCAGSFLAPVWIGEVSGQIVGDVKVTFDAISTPTAKADVMLFPDQVGFACELTPVAQVRVDLPPGPGTVEAVIEKVKIPVTSALMVQITPVIATPFYSRVLYDSASYASKVEFGCLPARGAASCI